MSTAVRVPETWELTGDDARETLATTGRLRLLKDAFMRLRLADGTSHARSLAFVTSLVLVQGLIVMVGFAAAFGSSGISNVIVDTIRSAAPGPAGDVLTHAVRAGEQGRCARSLPRALPRAGRHHLHGDDRDGSAGARPEPDLRRRDGPAFPPEVRNGVPARGQRRRRDRRVVRAARVGRRSEHRATVQSTSSGWWCAGRSG